MSLIAMPVARAPVPELCSLSLHLYLGPRAEEAKQQQWCPGRFVVICIAHSSLLSDDTCGNVCVFTD